MRHCRYHQRGVTLVEVAVVIAILLIIVTVLIPTISDMLRSVKGFREEAFKVKMQEAAAHYYVDNIGDFIGQKTMTISFEEVAAYADVSNATDRLFLETKFEATKAPTQVVAIGSATVAYKNLNAVLNSVTLFVVQGRPFVQAKMEETDKQLIKVKTSIENYYQQRYLSAHRNSPRLSYFSDSAGLVDQEVFYDDVGTAIFARSVRSQKFSDSARQALGLSNEDLITFAGTTISFFNAGPINTLDRLSNGIPAINLRTPETGGLPYTMLIYAPFPSVTVAMTRIVVSKL